MTQHTLMGRTEQEVLWFQRRSFMQAAAAWTAMGGFTAAHAQQRGNVVDFAGDILVNNNRLSSGQSIQTGDRIETGPGSNMVFVIGTSAFQVRQNSRLVAERGNSINAVSLLRMLTGAVVSVWGKGSSRSIVTPTITAGIRGTGVYTEVRPAENFRSYLCNCYGTVEVSAGADKTTSQTSYHQSFWGEAEPKNGRFITPAAAINHADEELEYLARLVNQPTGWQIMGKKGIKDGKGYMDDKPGQMHPADMMPR